MIRICIVVNIKAFNFATLAAIMETGVTLTKAINSQGVLFAEGTPAQFRALHGIGGTTSVSNDEEAKG